MFVKYFFILIDFVNRFVSQNWRPLLEITILSLLIYYVLLLIRGTRTVQVLKGIFLIVITFVLSRKLELSVINWILTMFAPIAITAIIIIFQPELRRGLARLGGSPFSIALHNDKKIPAVITDAVMMLSGKKIGGIIVLEREIGLKNYISTGIMIDSLINRELILSIFMPTSPMHDGAIIIEGNRIAASSCLLPLSQYHQVSKSLGTRHRAAIGLSEETDALVIVISEETGTVSIVDNGVLIHDVAKDKLISALSNLYDSNISR